MKTVLTVCMWLSFAATGFSQPDSVIYFNNNFDVVSKNEATYYRIKLITDTITGKGYQKDYFITGEKYRETNFSKLDSIKDGLTLSWFKNGQLRARTFYVNGNANGKSEDWYENGQLRWEHTYVNGHLHGDMKSYYLINR
ncbi:MAG: toxin-antitoxin system YwqK family antitoxin [Rufibacter sp.]